MLSFKPLVIPGYTKDWGQSVVITECVYRNMYRVKYLGLYDIDEYIVPQKVKTILELIYSIEFRSKRACIMLPVTVLRMFITMIGNASCQN